MSVAFAGVIGGCGEHHSATRAGWAWAQHLVSTGIPMSYSSVTLGERMMINTLHTPYYCSFLFITSEGGRP